MAGIEGIGSIDGDGMEPVSQSPSYEIEGSDQLTMLQPWNPKIIAAEVGLDLESADD